MNAWYLIYSLLETDGEDLVLSAQMCKCIQDMIAVDVFAQKASPVVQDATSVLSTRLSEQDAAMLRDYANIQDTPVSKVIGQFIEDALDQMQQGLWDVDITKYIRPRTAKVSLSARIDPELVARLKKYAKQYNVSQAKLIEAIINSTLASK